MFQESPHSIVWSDHCALHDKMLKIKGLANSKPVSSLGKGFRVEVLESGT